MSFDPQRAFDQLKRFAADAPAHLGDGVTRLVRDAPPQRLEQLMRSPARKALLDGLFWQMPKQVDRTAAAGISTSIRWIITGGPDGGQDTFLLTIDNGHARTTRDLGGDPRLTVTTDGAEFLRLVTGNSDPMKAYFKGRVQLTGDIMVAAKLARIFRMPGTGPDPEDPGGPVGPPPAPA